MFADLSPRIRLVDDLVIAQLVSDAHYRRSTVGEGLTLTPSLFTRHVSAPISAEVAPLLIYPSRGVGTVWNPGSLPTAAALERVVGAVRGRLLRLLDTPASATQLAVRLGVTTSAVNQQLRALHAAGLLTSARHGRSVLYLRSDLGDALTVGGGAATLRTKKGQE
jgi:DNA-binding transcriptional ArsR family regulator